MNYPTMCCEVESENRSVTEENTIKAMLEETQKILFETHDILLNISRNVVNMPSPENEIPKANCMNDQAIINRNLSGMCREMAMDIHRMLFGKG